MVFYYYIFKECPDNVRSTGSYIVFYQDGPIDNFTHVSGPVTQLIAEINYNAALNEGMALAYFRMINNDFLNKYPYVVSEHAPLIIFDMKLAVCMAKNGKDTKHTRHISRRMQLVRNGE